MDGSIPIWVYYIIGFPLLLGPLVTLHELGHYLVGRWFGVKAEAFSIGFGKEIWGRTDSRGTRWKVSALPLGGYVQFKGDMDPASIPHPEAAANATPEERDGSFHHASLGKRALIVFAGPAMNIIVTLAIFISFFMMFGKPVPVNVEEQMTIGSFSEQSAAPAAGVEVGDKIISVDGEPVVGFQELIRAVQLYPNTVLDIGIEREGEEMVFPVRTYSVEQEDRFGNKGTIGLIGITAAAERSHYDYEDVGLIQSAQLSLQQTGMLVDMMVTGIKQILVGDRSVKELGGPVTIGKYAGEQLSLGPLAFFNLAALISLNLAFINLLPIPALDGGHLAFYAAEAIRRKPLGPRSTEVAYRAGVALVLALMVFVTFIDIAKLPFFGN